MSRRDEVAQLLARVDNPIPQFERWIQQPSGAVPEGERDVPPEARDRWEALVRADQLALSVIEVANVLADPGTSHDVVERARTWIDAVYALDGGERDYVVWSALVEAIEEALAVRRKLIEHRAKVAGKKRKGRAAAERAAARLAGSPPAPSLKALANWVPAKVGARVPWGSYVNWLHENPEAIEATLARCEPRLDWKALRGLAMRCGVLVGKTPESMKQDFSRRRTARRNAK